MSAMKPASAIGAGAPSDDAVPTDAFDASAASPALNAYERKKAARIGRMRERADRREASAKVAHHRAQTILDVIPAGQPILAGHHSEKRHRRDLARADRGLQKAHSLDVEAKELRRRAESAENNRAISSDDPEALLKLRERLAELERAHARMREGNRLLRRSASPIAELRALGFSAHAIGRAITPNPLGREGFALSHSSAEIRTVRARIAGLEAQAKQAPRPPVSGDGAHVEEADNRVRIFFDAKPGDAMRKRIRRDGFVYSPTVGAWQRHASPLAWYRALVLIGRDPRDAVSECLHGSRPGTSNVEGHPNVEPSADPPQDAQDGSEPSGPRAATSK